MRVEVDYDRCETNAICMGIVPEVFEVRDDGQLYLLDATPPEQLRGRLEEAVRECPTEAISIVEA
jgi:ferredoxin